MQLTGTLSGGKHVPSEKKIRLRCPASIAGRNQGSFLTLQTSV
jgi:hypothetical protein